jgi:hypothetical protein
MTGGIDCICQSLAAKSRLTADDVETVWSLAARFDTSLRFRPSQVAALAAKRIEPRPYSRAALFERMLHCRPSLFEDFPIRRRVERTATPPALDVIEEIRSGFPRAKRARVRSRETVRFMAIPSVLDRWRQSTSVFGVTDLHYIGTRFDNRVDTNGLNDFNLLPRGTDGFQSQDSLVISTEGAVTDSHSDDHSGSNHSFMGTKLWLLWDTFEGFEHGLEDVEHSDVFEKAAFDLSAFIAIRSSCWILIGPGQTMFIPASLTHKVITLQPYLGLGSFHAGLPGFVDLLIRWARLKPQWTGRNADSERCSVGFLTRRAIRKVRSLGEADANERLRWGVPYLRERLQRADIGNGKAGRIAGDTSHLDAFLRAARRIAN